MKLAVNRNQFKIKPGFGGILFSIMAKRKIIMFLDNATVHRNLKLTNVKLAFFHANTTSKLQPLDLGIIRAMKARYRKYLMRRLLTGIENSSCASELAKKISLLDSAHWISKSWNETKCSTIQSCFSKAGFPLVDPSELSDESDTDDIPLAQLGMSSRSLGITDLAVSVSQIETCESDIPIEDIYEENWERQILEEHKQDELRDDDDLDEINNLPKEEKCANYSKVLNCLLKIENFAKEHDDGYLILIQDLKSLKENKIILSKTKSNQTTLDSFFKK